MLAQFASDQLANAKPSPSNSPSPPHPSPTGESPSSSLSAVQLAELRSLENRENRPRPPQVSAWQKENGCILLTSEEQPSLASLSRYRSIHAAYVRYVNNQHQVFYYYINKKTQECKKLELTKLKLLCLDLELRALEKPKKWLKDYELKRIETITGHAHRTNLQKFLHGFGKTCTFFMAFGCGASTAGTFIGLNFLTGGLASFFASIIFIAGTAVNWWMSDRVVSSVLSDFTKEKYFVDEKGQPLSTGKIVTIVLALGLSLSVGATFAALTYTSTGTLITAFPFLAFATPALPLIAGILALTTFVSLSALMLKDLADVIKNEDAFNKYLKFFRDISNTDPNLPHNRKNNHPKKRWRILLERSLTVIFTLTILGVSCVGLWMTMKACVPSIKDILLQRISGLPVATAEIISDVISLGLSFIGQVPFGVITALEAIAKANHKIFHSKQISYKIKVKEPQQAHANIWFGVKISNTIVNALSNGLIAMKGAITDITSGVFTVFTALTSGTFNSAAAAIQAILEEPILLKPSANKIPKRSRTLESIASQLSPETNKGIAYKLEKNSREFQIKEDPLNLYRLRNAPMGCTGCTLKELLDSRWFNPKNSTSTSVSQSSSSFFSPSSSSSASSSTPTLASRTIINSSSSSQKDRVDDHTSPRC